MRRAAFLVLLVASCTHSEATGATTCADDPTYGSSYQAASESCRALCATKASLGCADYVPCSCLAACADTAAASLAAGFPWCSSTIQAQLGCVLALPSSSFVCGSSGLGAPQLRAGACQTAIQTMNACLCVAPNEIDAGINASVCPQGATDEAAAISSDAGPVDPAAVCQQYCALSDSVPCSTQPACLSDCMNNLTSGVCQTALDRGGWLGVYECALAHPGAGIDCTTGLPANAQTVCPAVAGVSSSCAFGSSVVIE